MNFKAERATCTKEMIAEASIDKVFELYCPVKERDWAVGWQADVIKSNSGLVEKGCVFLTENPGKHPVVWYVTEYDVENHIVEMVYVAPEEKVVRLRIECNTITENRTRCHLMYEYTALTEAQNQWIRESVDDDFNAMMNEWEAEQAHYLATGEMLSR